MSPTDLSDDDDRLHFLAMPITGTLQFFCLLFHVTAAIAPLRLIPEVGTYCTVVGVGKRICHLHDVGIKMMRGLLFLLSLCFSVSATMTSTSNENKEVRLIR